MRHEGREFDFLDFGASRGDSIDFGIRKLGGTRGLGLDLDERKVEATRSAGHDCIHADACALDLDVDSVRFCVLSHFLEHLPDLGRVAAAIAGAARAASDFLFIQGPFFDADRWLAERGLKLYWSDWRGHPCHLSSEQLATILDDLGLDDRTFFYAKRIESSADPAVHPVASPVDQHDWDPALHPPKPKVRFPAGLFREMGCVVRLDPAIQIHPLLLAKNDVWVDGRRVDVPPSIPSRAWRKLRRFVRK